MTLPTPTESRRTVPKKQVKGKLGHLENNVCDIIDDEDEIDEIWDAQKLQQTRKEVEDGRKATIPLNQTRIKALNDI